MGKLSKEMIAFANELVKLLTGVVVLIVLIFNH